MKTCSKCNINKELSKFKIDVRYILGVTGVCKECYKVYARNNKASQKWVDKHIDLVKINQDKYVKNNPESVRGSKRKWSQANNKKVLANTRKYQSAKLKAVPMWLTDGELKEIELFYINCPKGYEVDHIIPLQGKNVCGLHVLSNLQYLKASENRKKSNKY
jgi:hypothetical protein